MRTALLLSVLALLGGCADSDKPAADTSEDATSVGTTDSGPAPELGTPDIDVPAAAMNFEAVAVGQRLHRTIDIRNRGDGALTLAGAQIVNATPQFEAGLPADPVIPAGGETRVDVYFTPTEAGEVVDTLSIASDDPDQPTVAVELFGLGVASDTPE